MTIVLADPDGSVFAPMFETGELVEQGKFLVEGVGKGNIRAPPSAPSVSRTSLRSPA